jgi:hypothetical protein
MGIATGRKPMTGLLARPNAKAKAGPTWNPAFGVPEGMQDFSD